MGFYIKYDDIRALMDTTQGQISTWENELKDVSLKLTNIQNMSGFQGSAAVSVKTYISEVHTVILQCFQIVFQGYLSHLAMYSNGYYSEIDDNRDTLIREDVLEDLKNQYGSKQSQINRMSSDLWSTFNNISDLIYLNPNGLDSINDRYACLNNRYQTLIDNVKSYEASNDDQLADLESAIGNLIAFINEYANATGGRGSQYVSGGYRGNKSVAGLASGINSVVKYVQDNSVAINEAYEHENKVRKEIYDEKVAEAAKAREKNGSQKMCSGAITAVGCAIGAVVIVASAGTLAPAVIVAAGIATAGGVYGVANFGEGNEEYHYGKIGDVTTAAWNPIRDTLFFGNQKAYDFTGMACTSATAIIAPIGACSAIISGTGTAEGIIINTANDMVAFSAISAGTEITGEQLGWSEPVKFGVELVAGLGFGAASIAIEKSISNAAGEISIKEARQAGSKTTDYFVGPNGKALPSQYENWIGKNIQEELLSQAENPQLQNAIKQLYRGKSFIGDGGTADVIKFEQETGIMLGKNGGSHVQKGIDMASYIENKILTQNLSETDRALATKLLDDLNNALGR